MVDKTGRIWIADKDKTILINKAGNVENISANNSEANKLLGGVKFILY